MPRNLMEPEGVAECATKSTSIQWTPIWRVLETSVRLHLVNPCFIRQLPGKKSDVKDAAAHRKADDLGASATIFRKVTDAAGGTVHAVES